ncbi:hypothetical protein [Ornithinimicrobium sp. INDO-MA30-4]|uniref:hypothetical protein n=1 Tax=Ornithinimicrobium sp. INDO-MA30-4 TaxID=2908651 RepID=UPI002882FFF4|nr:hypothetical protein [Ornithinimicrobium sp. INDO-MA30-4]
MRSHEFEGSGGITAELGGMRFPISSTGFYHYINMLGLETEEFPNPLTPAAGSTVIDLEGRRITARRWLTCRMFITRSRWPTTRHSKKARTSRH